MHFSQQITNIGTSRFMSNHRQHLCHRMIDSVCHSDAQGADATPPWNTLYSAVLLLGMVAGRPVDSKESQALLLFSERSRLVVMVFAARRTLSQGLVSETLQYSLFVSSGC
jgi:hypothetical protein